MTTFKTGDRVIAITSDLRPLPLEIIDVEITPSRDIVYLCSDSKHYLATDLFASVEAAKGFVMKQVMRRFEAV